jgi:hypothetical protein
MSDEYEKIDRLKWKQVEAGERFPVQVALEFPEDVPLLTDNQEETHESQNGSGSFRSLERTKRKN